MTIQFWQTATGVVAMLGLALIFVAFFSAVSGDRYDEQFFEFVWPFGLGLLLFFGVISLFLKSLL